MVSKAGNVKQVKKVNRMTVLDIIRKHELISRQELAKLTGLTPAAITGIVRELLDRGFVTEEGSGESSGGRRPVKLKFNHESGYVIGMEVTKHEAKVAVADLNNDPVMSKSIELDMSVPEDAIKRIAVELTMLMNTAEMKEKKFVGVGVAFPGLIMAKEGLVKKSVNLGPGWDNLPLKELIEQELDIPVYLENNSNAAVLAERWFGGGKNSRDLVYINIGEGVSAGIIINDKILHGYAGYAGEVGHIVIKKNGPLCNCGNRGCLESICSIPAVVSKANWELGLLRGNDMLKDIWSRKNEVNIDDILHCAQVQGSYSWQIIRQLGKEVGIGVANVINLYNPEVVFIGGELTRAKDIFLEPMLATIATNCFPEIAKITRVEISELGKKSGAFGACALAVRELFNPSKAGILEKQLEHDQII